MYVRIRRKAQRVDEGLGGDGVVVGAEVLLQAGNAPQVGPHVLRLAEQAAKELHGIAQVLQCNAQLMALHVGHVRQVLAAFQRAATQPVQNPCGIGFRVRGEQAQGLPRQGRSPRSAGEKILDVNHEQRGPRILDQPAGCDVTVAPAGFHRVEKRAGAAHLPGPVLQRPGQGIGAKGIAFPRRTKRRCDAPCLRPDVFEFGQLQGFAEHTQRTAQPAQRHAQLMDRFGRIGAAQCGPIGREMAQGIGDDGCHQIIEACASRNAEWRRLLGPGRLRGRKAVTAAGLRLEFQAQPAITGQCRRQPKQVGHIAALQFKLHFRQRQAGRSGRDGPLVQCEFNFGMPVAQHCGAALEARFEDGRERSACGGSLEPLAHDRFEQLDIGNAVRATDLDLAACEHGIVAAQPFDAHERNGPAFAPHTQCHAGSLQLMAFRVEIGGDQLPRRTYRHRLEQPGRQHGLQCAPVGAEFHFNFLRRRLLRAGARAGGRASSQLLAVLSHGTLPLGVHSIDRTQTVPPPAKIGSQN